MTSAPRCVARRPLGLPRYAALVVSTLAALSIGLGTTAWVGPSWAETADEARQRADLAAAEVEQLQVQVDEAQARYSAALSGLAGAVTKSVAADRDAMLAAEAAQQTEADRTEAVRVLNQSGGTLGMMETVLSADTPAEVAARWRLSQTIMMLLAERSTAAETTTDAAEAASQQWQANADHQIASVDDVESAYTELQALLDQQETILEGLDTRARRLAVAERAAERLAAERAAAAAAAAASASSATAGGIPKNFLKLYRAAGATCQGLPWPILAAVGQVESGHGTNNGPSSSGALGPMQFLPSTFAAYAVDGDKDGDTDIWDPADAIYSAAKYLCANGAGAGPRGLYTALWHYNHADWYVLMVVNIAGQIAKRFGEPVPVAEGP